MGRLVRYESLSEALRRWAVCLVGTGLVVLCCAVEAQAQLGSRPGDSGRVTTFSLEQNYPNPFNPETTVPFTLGEDLFVDGRPAVVSVRIFNVLSQLVAHPVALGHPSGDGAEVDELEYSQPGQYEAFWDGTDQMGRQVASGIYLLQLTVNGQSATRKMYVLK